MHGKGGGVGVYLYAFPSYIWKNKQRLISCKKRELAYKHRGKQKMKEFVEENLTPEDLNMDPGQETKKEEKGQVFDDNYEIPNDLNVGFINKNTFLESDKIVTITGLGKNKFGRDVLLVNFNGEETSINISKLNMGQLTQLFGKKLSNWKGQTVNVSGESFEGDPLKNLTPGVKLTFTKA